MNLAEEFRRAEIKVGDIVEVSNFPDTLSARIAESIGEPEAEMEGLLIEVTAITDQSVLCYWLNGHPKGSLGKAYNSYEWIRSERESGLRGERMFAKVGRRTIAGIEWLFPDRDNIYSRCQD